MGVLPDDVISIVADMSGQTEIGYFHEIFGRHEDIAGGQIAMDDALFAEILHSLRENFFFLIKSNFKDFWGWGTDLGDIGCVLEHLFVGDALVALNGADVGQEAAHGDVLHDQHRRRLHHDGLDRHDVRMAQTLSSTNQYSLVIRAIKMKI